MTEESSPTQLIIDAGNTRIKFALFEYSAKENQKEQPESLPRCLKRFSVPNQKKSQGELFPQELQVAPGNLKRTLLSGSDFSQIERLVSCWPSRFPAPQIVQKGSELPVRLEVQAPEKVGLDRILNAVSVNQIRKDQHWAIIVDTGTATTIDLVSSEGAFLGGVIQPGYELAAHSLHDYTNLLPLIPMEEIINDQAPAVIGKCTEDAVRSGLIWGQVGAVNEIVKRITELQQKSTPSEGEYYLTGGAALLLEPHLNFPFKHFPDLTLQGLSLL